MNNLITESGLGYVRNMLWFLVFITMAVAIFYDVTNARATPSRSYVVIEAEVVYSHCAVPIKSGDRLKVTSYQGDRLTIVCPGQQAEILFDYNSMKIEFGD